MSDITSDTDTTYYNTNTFRSTIGFADYIEPSTSSYRRIYLTFETTISCPICLENLRYVIEIREHKINNKWGSLFVSGVSVPHIKSLIKKLWLHSSTYQHLTNEIMRYTIKKITIFCPNHIDKILPQYSENDIQYHYHIKNFIDSKLECFDYETYERPLPEPGHVTFGDLTITSSASLVGTEVGYIDANRRPNP